MIATSNLLCLKPKFGKLFADGLGELRNHFLSCGGKFPAGA